MSENEKSDATQAERPRGNFAGDHKIVYKTHIDLKYSNELRTAAKALGLGASPTPVVKPPKVLGDPNAPLTHRAGRLRKEE